MGEPRRVHPGRERYSCDRQHEASTRLLAGARLPEDQQGHGRGEHHEEADNPEAAPFGVLQVQTPIRRRRKRNDDRGSAGGTGTARQRPEAMTARTAAFSQADRRTGHAAGSRYGIPYGPVARGRERAAPAPPTPGNGPTPPTLRGSRPERPCTNGRPACTSKPPSSVQRHQAECRSARWTRLRRSDRVRPAGRAEPHWVA